MKLMLEEEEVSTFYYVKLGHNHQPGGFMYQSINVSEIRGIVGHLIFHPQLMDIFG